MVRKGDKGIRGTHATEAKPKSENYGSGSQFGSASNAWMKTGYNVATLEMAEKAAQSAHNALMCLTAYEPWRDENAVWQFLVQGFPVLLEAGDPAAHTSTRNHWGATGATRRSGPGRSGTGRSRLPDAKRQRNYWDEAGYRRLLCKLRHSAKRLFSFLFRPCSYYDSIIIHNS